MSFQVNYILGQTEGRRKTILEWGKGLMLNSLSLSLYLCGEGLMLNYYVSIDHPIPTQGNKEHPFNLQNKSVSSPFNRVSR